jgi:mono/diheme cytochrome c family protein
MPCWSQSVSIVKSIYCANSIAFAILTLGSFNGVCGVDVSKLPQPANRQVDFVRDVQPIFASRCYQCHGATKQEAEFRLDDKTIALKGGDLGPAIVPGKSAESLLIHFVGGLVDGKVMPKKGERLSSEQIGILRAWIDQGANWPDSVAVAKDTRLEHWAFKAPVRSQLPSVKNKKWVRNAIDNFVLARLEKDKLKPSSEADRVTIIRRLSLDLIGLPPTPKEIDAFIADKSPDAYEKVVERLLASPHYGERWGRHWLDAARYADTNGYEKDRERSIWPYRDWVINAFNRDLSFDQFTIEQLAGDLLPKPTLQQRVATGFLRNSMLNQEGGVEPEQFRHEAIVDRVEAVGRAWLGLTVQCAQCHNHKFDPVSQKEYYQLFAFLNNDNEPFLEVPTAAESKKRKEILAKVRELEEKAMKETTNLTARMATWETNLVDAKGDWTVLDPTDWHNFASKFEKQPDKSLLGGGDPSQGGVMKVWVETFLTNVTGFRLEALADPNLPYDGPGFINKGSFLIKEFTVEAYPLTNITAFTNVVKFSRAIADMEAPGFAVTNAIDGVKDKGGWCPATTPDARNKNHVAVFECKEQVGFPGGTKLLISLHETAGGGDDLDSHVLGSFRLSTTTKTNLNADPLSVSERKILATPAEKRTKEQTLTLFRKFRLNDGGFAELNKKIAEAFKEWPYPATTLALQQRNPPRVTHIFKRGDRLRPGEEVQSGTPAILHSFSGDAPRNRLGLAKWIVDSKNPTTARVIVNRVWQNYFGQGLVTTPEDFGVRAEASSHPELLDWLAREFSDSGWSMKKLHRLIVTSATYRQNSKVTPELLARDPYNRLLAHGPRFRVEAEVVQDIALSASGLLNPKIGGPSVRPPIPSSVGDTVYGGFSWPESKGEDRYRRGMYTFWKRSLPFPTLAAFDMPSGETSCGRRTRSNTPLQALTTLNEKTFVEAAQGLALRVSKDGGANDADRIRFAFRLCTGRAPTKFEEAKLLNFWREQFIYFENHSSSALKVALPDVKQLPDDANVHKVAAWAMVSRAILNLDETVTKE